MEKLSSTFKITKLNIPVISMEINLLTNFASTFQPMIEFSIGGYYKDLQ